MYIDNNFFDRKKALLSVGEKSSENIAMYIRSNYKKRICEVVK